MTNCALPCSRSMLSIACSIIAFSVTACAACPPLVDYPPAFQDAAAAELVDAGAAIPHVATMIADYGRERDLIRACR